jgi:hypothetical protein
MPIKPPDEPQSLLSLDPSDPLLDPLQQPPEPHLSSVLSTIAANHQLALADEHKQVIDSMAAMAPAVARLIADHAERLFTTAPSASPARKTSSPEAQALLSGALQGLGSKYGDPNLTAAGQELEQRLLGSMPTMPTKPTKLLPKPITAVAKAKARARRTRNRRQP